MLLLLEWRVRAILDAVPSGVGRFGPSIGFERLDRDSMQQYTGDLRVFFQGFGSVRRARDLQVLRDEQGYGSLIHFESTCLLDSWTRGFGRALMSRSGTVSGLL